MSPIVEKMEGLKTIRNRSNSLRLGRLALYKHLEKVGTMRSFWELKHVELEGENQVVGTVCVLNKPHPITANHMVPANDLLLWLHALNTMIFLSLIQYSCLNGLH